MESFHWRFIWLGLCSIKGVDLPGSLPRGEIRVCNYSWTNNSLLNLWEVGTIHVFGRSHSAFIFNGAVSGLTNAFFLQGEQLLVFLNWSFFNVFGERIVDLTCGPNFRLLRAHFLSAQLVELVVPVYFGVGERRRHFEVLLVGYYERGLTLLHVAYSSCLLVPNQVSFCCFIHH